MHRLMAAVVSLIGWSTVLWAQSPPNILFIYTDDQGPWALGADGNSDAHTPNMDRLAREGARFSHFFVTTPVCSPSRAGLIASRYGTEVDIMDWIAPRPGKNRGDESERGLDPALPTWVRILRDGGYRTGLVGKWHLGTQDQFLPVHFGYDYFYGFREGGANVTGPELEHGGTIAVEEGYTTNLLTDHALDFLRDAAGKDQPFMLSVHYRAPHAPWLPVPEEDMAPFEGKELALPNPDFPNLDKERVARIMKEYLASVAGVDRNVGRLLSLLEDLEIAADTVVIFTSDHGYNVGHHGILHKGNASWITTDDRNGKRRTNLFDTSLRVPALVRWPGHVKPGTVVDRCVTNLDWFPTLVALGGGKMPGDALVHGRNFLPMLLGETITWDDTVYAQYAIHHYTNADLHAVRTRDWKLVRDYMIPGRDELYDLKNDPGETVNLIDDGGHAGVIAELDVELNRRRRALRLHE